MVSGDNSGQFVIRDLLRGNRRAVRPSRASGDDNGQFVIRELFRANRRAVRPSDDFPALRGVQSLQGANVRVNPDQFVDPGRIAGAPLRGRDAFLRHAALCGRFLPLVRFRAPPLLPGSAPKQLEFREARGRPTVRSCRRRSSATTRGRDPGGVRPWRAHFCRLAIWRRVIPVSRIWPLPRRPHRNASGTANGNGGTCPLDCDSPGIGGQREPGGLPPQPPRAGGEHEHDLARLARCQRAGDRVVAGRVGRDPDLHARQWVAGRVPRRLSTPGSVRGRPPGPTPRPREWPRVARRSAAASVAAAVAAGRSGRQRHGYAALLIIGGWHICRPPWPPVGRRWGRWRTRRRRSRRPGWRPAPGSGDDRPRRWPERNRAAVIAIGVLLVAGPDGHARQRHRVQAQPRAAVAGDQRRQTAGTAPAPAEAATAASISRRPVRGRGRASGRRGPVAR